MYEVIYKPLLIAMGLIVTGTSLVLVLEELYWWWVI